MTAYQNSVCNRAVYTYGKTTQLIMAMEEMSELIQALSKDIRGKTDIENIAEEIADVEIMLAQLKIIFDCKDKVNSKRCRKISRLEERLNSYI